MLVVYPRTELGRGGAWRDLLRNKPVYAHGPYRFQPADHDFRKDHGGDSWGWYVDKWRYLGEEIFPTPPCAPPEPVLVATRWTHRYVWAVWKDHDGTECCGFVLGQTYANGGHRFLCGVEPPT